MIDHHRRMLADATRTEAFARALKRVIVPGKTTVADIGAGTGILSFLAIKLGAKKCYLYEQGPVLALAKKLAAENRMQKQCVFIPGSSLHVRSPVKCDVVISETLGNFAYEEHLIENLADAARFLAPGGTMIPCGLTQHVAPVVNDRLWKELTVWRDVGHGLAFGAAEETTFHNVYVRTVKPEDLLEKGSARVWDRVRFPGKNGSARKATVTWTADRPATVYGFAVWWEAELVPGVTLSTSPFAKATHWEQIVLPLRKPIAAKSGDIISIELHSDSRLQTGINVQWSAAQKRAGKTLGTQAYDMKKGML